MQTYFTGFTKGSGDFTLNVGNQSNLFIDANTINTLIEGIKLYSANSIDVINFMSQQGFELFTVFSFLTGNKSSAQYIFRKPKP